MSSQQQTASVLVVDDNPTNIDLLSNMLQRFDHTVYTASNGHTALEIVAKKLPDIVLLDISMPEMDGYDVCRHIKADEATQDIPVIFISALDDTQNMLDGFEVGAVDYITKPFKYREVLARINTQVTLMRQQREIQALRENEKQQYERMAQLQRQFIGSATHDLKNPLFVISGYADMIEMLGRQQGNQQLLSFVESIRRGTNKMSDLVYDILDLLQLESKTRLDRELVDLQDLLETIVRDMQMRATKKDITLTLHPIDKSPTLNLDRRRINRVLDNLISNAIKYTPTGGAVDVKTHITQQSVQIDIQDTGLGIPSDELATIFEPFQRVNTEEHMAQEGTGLGLSIVKTLVEQHGGSITVESTMGEGSCFSVTLPKT
ncbi:MAG: hybrid sensor histidine kinase/response regulator [Chloroflexota bacterium]